MALWSRWIFPRLCHAALSSRELAEQRRELLAVARGRVLELGVGSGLNLPHYPDGVTRVDGVDPNPGMHVLTGRTLASGEVRSGLAVELHEARGEALPFADGAFDCVVSTWTLCSVGDVGRVLAEVHRVLGPGGRLLYLEHGLSPEAAVARWQRRLGPLQRRFADGCHLDRDFTALLAASPLEAEREERFYLDKVPRFGGYMYRGAALRTST